MIRWLVILISGAMALNGCRGKPKDAAGGMTAEEHARMLAADSTPRAPSTMVHLTAEQATAIGVTYTTVTRGPLDRTVRTVGQIAAAEPNVSEITARIDGFVERIFVDATGMSVRQGQPLLTIYSPMLVTGQQELLLALRLARSVDTTSGDAWRSAQELVMAARRRLANWEISAAQIAQLERTGEVTRTLTLDAPASGVVLEKMVVKGQTVMAGMKLYRLADLSTVWVEGEVFEQDIGVVRVGTAARLEVAAYPGRSFTGRVSFVAPTVNDQSRAGRVRIALANAGGLLKPGMYATAFLNVSLGRAALSLPAEAVVMTGERNLVFVANTTGGLEPREVVLGAHVGNRLEILRGVVEGERVVASANFLVDAESRLATGAGKTAMPGMDMPAPKPERRP